MKNSLGCELRNLFPAWLGCVLLPLPAILLPDADEGVPWRFSCFAIGCAGLAAYAFRSDGQPPAAGELNHLKQAWARRMAASGIALLLAAAIFFLFCLTLSRSHDFIVLLKAVYVSILALCIVPYLAVTTRKPFIAVVLAIFLVFCLKLLGCVVVVLVYGWDASEHGYTTTPWTHPNLLVWLFWSFTTVLSLSFYFLGKIKFCGRQDHID